MTYILIFQRRPRELPVLVAAFSVLAVAVALATSNHRALKMWPVQLRNWILDFIS